MMKLNVGYKEKILNQQSVAVNVKKLGTLTQFAKKKSLKTNAIYQADSED